MKCVIQGKHPSDFDVRVGDERVIFGWIIQRMIGTTRPHSEPTKPASEPLRLQISPYRNMEGIRLVWEDKGDDKIEDHIEEIVATVILAGEVQYRQNEVSHHRWLVERKAQLIEEARKRKEEAERKEREQRIREENMRVERLLGEAAAFRQANDIRAYVELVRETNRVSAESVNQQELEAWAAWALAQDDRIDPVRTRKFLAPDPDGSS